MHEVTPEYVLEEMKNKNVILEAYPGWGKTLLAGKIADSVDSISVVVRTHEEIAEVLKFTSSRIIPLYGKEKLCPLWQKGDDVSVYRFCKRMRILGLCRYKYKAIRDIVKWIAGRPRSPNEIREKAKSIGYCPYPSILVLAKNKKLVTTYGFAFAFRDVLSREFVVFDESHEMLSVLVGLIERVDEVYIDTVVRMLKKDVDTRRLAYFIRTCWRKTKSFSEFVRMLERAPDSSNFIDSLLSAFYGKRIYWKGKEAWILPSKLRLRREKTLYLTAYLPPFLIDMIPNSEVIRVTSPERTVDVYIDADATATSRYEERSEEMYKLYAKKIEDYYVANEANLVMFPSYEFMDAVKQYLPDYIKSKIKPPEYIRTATEGDIIFDVAGGRATEGVNPSSVLGRVIVIGLPYPPPSGELNLLAKIYGFDSVYTYLGLLKVVQAIGRLRFRKGADAILIDRRYKSVAKYFPSYFDIRS